MTAKRNVYLVGFSGCGKTVVGRQLARRLKARFIDTDSVIARTAGKDISRIFSDNGEPYFRRLERQVIASVTRSAKGKTVVALGGGAFEDRANRQCVRESGVVVYLSCSLKVLYNRLKDMRDRPMLAQAGSAEKLKGRIRKLRDRRVHRYREADITVSTSARTATQTAREIAKKLQR